MISLIKQTNYKVYMQYTVQLHCTLYHKDKCSVSQKAAREEDLRDECNGDLKGHYLSGQNYLGLF